MKPIQFTLTGFVVGLVVGMLGMVQVLPPTAALLTAGAPDGSDGTVAHTDPGSGEGAPGDPDAPPGQEEAPGVVPGPGTTLPPSAGGPGGGPAPGGGSGRGGGGGESGGGNGTGGGGGTGDGGGSGSATTPPAGSDEIACEPGRNGGATDRGVFADRIVLATTVAESGSGSAFLGESRFGMEAVRNEVNRQGGICGRRLEIIYRDDAWQAQRGAGFLRNFIGQDVFAIAVGPSSEGLNAVIESGDFDTSQTPVVGTNGLIVSQYERRSDGQAQPWVWPVAAATVSSARIMAKDAFDRMVAAGRQPEAADFSVVFDANYKFGQEGAEAFNAEVRRLTGGDIPGHGQQGCSQSYCGVAAGQNSYSSQVQQFREGRFIALFLEPETAVKWMTDPNASPADPVAGGPEFGYGAAQPLFNENFANSCRSRCHRMVTWSGYKPFEEQYRSDPAVQAYVNALQATCLRCDAKNQFTQGSYIGMQLLVEAIRQTGPNLTRQGLKQTLDRMEFQCALCLEPTLRYTPSNRYVATTMQGWVTNFTGGQFAGWRDGNIVSDPRFR